MQVAMVARDSRSYVAVEAFPVAKTVFDHICTV